jgi:SAM-dependent methyltransferase
MRPSMRALGERAAGIVRRAAPRLAALPARQAYALWAADYPPVPHTPVMHAEQALMAPIVGARSASRALDVGSGSGRYLPVLAGTGARLVVGVDFSLPMLARETGPSGARVCGDALQLPFAAASFDLVSSALMLGDVVDLGRWMAEISRVLADGGHLVYSDFHPSWADRGWRRTFRDRGGRLIELPCHTHSLDQHHACLAAHGFEVRAIHEVGVEGHDGFASAGKIPVVVVVHAVKRIAPPPVEQSAGAGRR